MHGRGRSPYAEYTWRPEWTGNPYNAQPLPCSHLQGAPLSVLQRLRSSIKNRDAEGCKTSLDQLPQTTTQQPNAHQLSPLIQWEVATPPYFRVAHEAVCGNEGAFAHLDLSALELVRFLHVNGAEMDAQDSDGRTPLWIAADRGEMDVIRYLVNECGASANTRDLGGWTPLNAAVERCDAEAVSILVGDGKADVNTRDDLGFTPLHAAAAMRWLDMMKLLRSFGADADIPCDDDGKTALHSTVSRFPDESNPHSRIWSFWKERKPCSPLECVKILTGPLCQANVHVKDDSENTPMLVVIRNYNLQQRFEVMQYLHEECGADICVSDITGNALHLAVWARKKISEVRYLIERGVDPNGTDHEGNTPLHELFCQIGKLNDNQTPLFDIARFLTSEECSALSPHGLSADIDARNEEGETPLLYFLSTLQNIHPSHYLDPLRLFVNSLGAKVADVSDTHNNTALHVYLYRDHWTRLFPGEKINSGVLDELLAVEGVDIDARNDEGLTPLHRAIKQHGPWGDVVAELVYFLHSRGASIQTMDNNGWTPLHEAAASGQREVCKALVECGAELDVPDQNGLSPVQLAELHMYKSPDLPADYHWMSDSHLRHRWRPVAKYLRKAGSTVPTWWTPTNLVGRILSGESQRVLEQFANSKTSSSSSSITARRPHVARLVHAQRLLEGASIHGVEVEEQIRQLIAAGDLEGANETLSKIIAQKAMQKYSTCSICAELLHEEEAQQEDTEKISDVSLPSDVEKLNHGKTDSSNICGKENYGQEEQLQNTQQDRADHATRSVSAPKTPILSCPNLHPFHAGCLADLLLGGNFHCPVCRARMPVAVAVDVRSISGDLESTKEQKSLFTKIPQTVDETVAAVEQRARELECDEDNSHYRDNSSTICRELLVRARNELLRSGQIDGTLLTRGVVALRASYLSSRHTFGIQLDPLEDDESSSNESEEDNQQTDETREGIAAPTFPRFAASVGFGRGLLDPRVQQIMLTGDIARVKLARGKAQQRLIELRETQQSVEVDMNDEEQENEYSGDVFGQSSIGIRQAQAKMRKQRAKKNRRQSGKAVAIATNTAASEVAKPLFLGRRELSEKSKEAVETLSSDIDRDGSGGGSAMADASRGHRYLELAARVAGAGDITVPSHIKPINPQSKATLREAVSGGDVDSAARHLRRSRISAHMEHAGSSNVAEIETIDEDVPVTSMSKGGTKKQRKRRAELRRRQMTMDTANSLGHPVCCCCETMVETALLKPPCTHVGDDSVSFSVQLAAESLAAGHATCVNGHTMHANCFSRLVASALPCPSCNEPLIAPPVIQRSGEGDDCCGGSGADGDGGQDSGESDVVDAQLNVRLDFMAMNGLCFFDEDEYGQRLSGSNGVSGGDGALTDLRQCPNCGLGPLFNKDCADLNYHHGECQGCGARVISRRELEGTVARRIALQRKKSKKERSKLHVSDGEKSDDEMSVMDALPTCKKCLSQRIKSKVWYNGCMGCGMSFAPLSWDSLPPYVPPPEMYGTADDSDEKQMPRRRTYLDSVRLERRTIRLVAALEEQLHDEIVSFLHEERALVDEERRRANKEGWKKF